MNKGFTLVELSIVLVIIGLLIGGILVAQSMIESAKINEAVRQIQQFDAAVGQFQSRFKQLPGDSSLFTPAGNNDGTLSSAYIVPGGAPVCGVATCREYMSFWKHLSDSSVLKGSYTNDYSASFVAGVNNPEFLEDSLYVTYNATDNGISAPKGWYYAAAYVSSQLAIPIDVKLDDQSHSTGFVRLNSAGIDPCTISTNFCEFYMTIMSTTGAPLNN